MARRFKQSDIRTPITIALAARMMRCGEEQIRALCVIGLLIAVKSGQGSRWTIDRESVARLDVYRTNEEFRARQDRPVPTTKGA